MPIVTEPRRKSPLPTVAVGKCVSKSRRGAFFAAFLHNSSSPFAAYVFLLYSSLDFCAHSRSVLIHSNSRRLFARDPKTRHRTPSFRARAVYSRFDMYSHIESKRVSARTPYVCAPHTYPRVCAPVRTDQLASAVRGRGIIASVILN